jgi:hypothetical protein
MVLFPEWEQVPRTTMNPVISSPGGWESLFVFWKGVGIGGREERNQSLDLAMAFSDWEIHFEFRILMKKESICSKPY